MERTSIVRSFCMIIGLTAAAIAWSSCSANTSTSGAGSGFGGSGGSGASDSTGIGAHFGTGGDGGGLNGGDAGKCSTCKELDATCGPVTDPKCGGIIQCGDCPTGKTCGGGGEHNQCGKGNPDGCAPLSCADQNLTCGQAGDGCGNSISCGSCTSPQTCGGDPAHLGTCGCQGVCSQIPDCSGSGMTTTLTGKVLDPAGLHPLYNALVYIPNDPNDPGLAPFPAGITCDVCGATAAGNPLVTTLTAPDGTFTLSNVPVGATIPLIIQLGRWRRQFTVAINNACVPNAVPAGTLTMPKNQGEGDIPRIGILSGALDPIECVLRKMGVQDSEFTNPSGTGRIQFYSADADDPHSIGGQGAGQRINASTPPQSSLFAVQGGVPVINQYDLVLLECEGYPETEPQAQLDAIKAYADSGGRVFASDYAYAWYANNQGTGVFQSVANWHLDQGYVGTKTGVIDQISNPKGADFKTWLENVGVSTPGSGTVSITPVFRNSDGVVAPTQQWLYWAPSHPIHFTWNTPVGADSSQQCGRVVYSDWHAHQTDSAGTTFPSACENGPMTAQEATLEFMLFDLTSCVTPYMPICTPTTCAAQSIECGPAGDGCGNLIDCGPCQSPDTCGGGGPGKCGTSPNCMPETCAKQHLECGPAGDGCGNVLDCGNCPTGEVCGFGSPGHCGSPH